MVSTSTDDRSSRDPRGRDGYRRRRPLPAIVLLTVLAVFVVVVWVQVLTKSSQVASTTNCPPPTAATGSATIDVGAPPAELGTKVASDALEKTAPAAPKATQVRVLNANGQRGQASLVAAQLSQLGFGAAPDKASGNDTVYTSQNMQCQAQIRFGPAGAASARTVELLVPCAELIQDNRKDGGVDLALGTAFTALNSDGSASSVLAALTKHAVDPQAPAPDAAAVSAVHNVSC